MTNTRRVQLWNIKAKFYPSYTQNVEKKDNKHPRSEKEKCFKCHQKLFIRFEDSPQDNNIVLNSIPTK